ncbi:hypothetical protein BCR35DRAFT_291172 [Leucosporidium creatinivorum]|uniref:HSF-type DNA-binding domain-containing protein n=1 Tax=Leucosporidium creatinivorum TaxID=106004 RepID=A0A1Y2F9R5_9BASI|nr:hypothetical protein BCR35DRAFT_291172 [Leucosporidium creatinivorum]
MPGMEVALSQGPAPPAVKPTGVNKATAKSVPAFLNKLFSMVNDPETDDLIHWSKDGDSFLVPSADRFAREVLPRFFKHSNFGSFVRQCNMYGFHKVPNLQQGVLKNDDGNELLEFSNPNFLQAQPDLLCLIRRQKARGDHTSSETALDLPSLLTDLAAIRKHQTAISADLKDLQTSNHALWQEAIQSRERHTRQQETINKILRFLATVFGGQVVGGDTGASTPRDNVVVEDDETPSSGGKGKGKSTDGSRIVVPKMRSRLLLEDVKGRQEARDRERRSLEVDDEDEDDDDIEEIPLLREELDDMPTISRSSQYAIPPKLSRSGSSNNSLAYANISPNKHDQSASSRFSTLSSSTPTPTLTSQAPTLSDNQYQLSPDVLSSLLGSNPNALDAFSQFQNGFGASSAPMPSTSTLTPSSIDPTGSLPSNSNYDFSRALLPSPNPATASQPNPLEALLPGISSSSSDALFSPSDFSEDYRSAIQDHSQVMNDVVNEKADIDKRTTALEAAIAKLMQTLPEETREALSSAGGVEGQTLESLGLGADFGAGASPARPAGTTAEGMQWGAGGVDNDIDLDQFLAQYVNNPGASAQEPQQDPIDYSLFFDPSAASNGTGSSALPSHLNGTSSQFEVLSPSAGSVSGASDAGISTATSTPAAMDDDEDYSEGPAKKGRKRKSDAVEPMSPEGGEATRRSARKKRV